MAKQMLLYETVAPVNHARHGKWSLDRGRDFSYCKTINACPLMVSEFRAAAATMPVVFSQAEGGAVPAVVLGLEQHRSAMVAEDGSWKGRYIPAFIRRYPFVFAASQDGDQFTLCLDESYAGLDRAGERGDRLFADDGEPTETMTSALEFTKNFEIENRRTQAFCKILEELALLDPMNAQVTMPDGTKRALTGFQTVSRDRLKALPADAVKTLFDSDALELIYLHLSSLGNIDLLAAG